MAHRSGGRLVTEHARGLAAGNTFNERTRDASRRRKRSHRSGHERQGKMTPPRSVNTSRIAAAVMPAPSASAMIPPVKDPAIMSKDPTIDLPPEFIGLNIEEA